MIIYLAGPMTGLPEHNYPAFHAAACWLRAQGHQVYNPAEYPYDGPKDAFPIRAAFAEYARFISLDADAIVLLPGAERSVGAAAEIALARAVGIQVIEYASLWEGA